ncbi:hypothetical protein D3C81_1380160 [compost metagenome]
MPVLLGRLQHVGTQQRTGTRATAQLDALGAVDVGQRRQHAGGDALVHQQGFHGVARRVAMGLGVVGDANGLVEVGGDVDVDVADAVQVLDHRHAGVTADALDQALAATRHDDVDELRHGDQRAHGGAVGGFHHLHAGRRQAGFSQAKLDAAGDGAIGMDRLGAATQDGRVAGLQAQAGSVDGHVGPRLVDDADDAQRYAHLADLDARGQVAHVADGADRIGQAGDLAQALDHVVDARRGQRQAVEHGLVQAVAAAVVQVLRVGAEQLLARGVEGAGGGQQGVVLLRGGGASGDARSLARGATQAGHVVEYGLGHGLGDPASGKSR